MQGFIYMEIRVFLCFLKTKVILKEVQGFIHREIRDFFVCFLGHLIREVFCLGFSLCF